jgi:hypothetical protein
MADTEDTDLEPDRYDGGIDLYGIDEDPWITDDQH